MAAEALHRKKDEKATGGSETGEKTLKENCNRSIRRRESKMPFCSQRFREQPLQKSNWRSYETL